MTVTIGPRELLAALGGAAATWPLAVRAEQGGRMRRIGVLMPFAESDPEYQDSVASFRDALVKLGWVEGRNLRIDYRWAGSCGPASAAGGLSAAFFRRGRWFGVLRG